MVSYPGNIKDWVEYHKLEVEDSGNFKNIYVDKNLDDLFESPLSYKYMDGFSPNLNKFLHLGHLSNLIIAKTLKSMNICENTISIYGDTLSGIDKNISFSKLKEYQELFGYKPDIEYMASEMKYDGDLLKDGDGEYLGTKIFEIDEFKAVGIKSDGSTSYFYQDMALANILNDSTLYLTGLEQSNHFELLSKFHKGVKHISLGLVKLNGSKMSSSLGNVVYLHELLEDLEKKFDDNKLVYNILVGFILKNTLESDKNITLSSIDNPKNSPGLYLSYTMASLKSAGCEIKEIDNFSSKYLQNALIKSKVNLKPNILFGELVNLCKEINGLYKTHYIKDNKGNKEMFEIMLNDLALGFKHLGLFEINKV